MEGVQPFIHSPESPPDYKSERCDKEAWRLSPDRSHSCTCGCAHAPARTRTPLTPKRPSPVRFNFNNWGNCQLELQHRYHQINTKNTRWVKRPIISAKTSVYLVLHQKPILCGRVIPLSSSWSNERASPDCTIICHGRTYNLWRSDVCRLKGHTE